MMSEMSTTVRTVGECQPMDIAGLWPSSPIRSPSLAGKGVLNGEVMTMVNKAPALVYGSNFPNQPFSSPSLAGKGLGDRF